MNSLKKKLNQLSNFNSEICVSISYPTHRIFPDNKQDKVLLKKLVVEAEKNVIHRFGKRTADKVLEKLAKIEDDVDEKYNLDSCHVFISESIYEIIRLPVSISNSEVIINTNFNTFYIKKAIDDSKEYLILLLLQGGVHLYHAMNDSIVAEIRTNNFPFTKNEHYLTDSDKLSDAKQVDKMVREYFNKVDKSVQKEHKKTNLPIVVICTPRNYRHLLVVADKPTAYIGNAKINYNDVSSQNLSKQAWELIG